MQTVKECPPAIEDIIVMVQLQLAEVQARTSISAAFARTEEHAIEIARQAIAVMEPLQVYLARLEGTAKVALLLTEEEAANPFLPGAKRDV